jgi:hypothetical protein
MSNVELAAKAKAAALKHIRNDVERGISEREIRLSHHGHSCDEYWADVGLDQRYKPGGKKYPTTKVVVSKLNGRECLFVFSLHELYVELSHPQLQLFDV